jgi:DNA-nicking Smr family endonuclease
VAGRRLSPEEAALWRRVAGSVRPVSGRPIFHPDPGSGAVGKKAAELRSAKWVADHGRHDGLAKAKKCAQPANTLDGSWDRQIGTGRILPERTIDLHGHNLAGAHLRLERGLEDAVRDGVRIVLLVTGRPPRSGTSRIDLPLRGIIRESVGDWLAASRHAAAIAAVRGAHPRHGGAGALYVILRRHR